MNHRINVLMLGGGNRVSLARRFKIAGTQLGVQVTVFSYDISLEQPIVNEATVLKGHRWSDRFVTQHIVEIIDERQIDLVLACVDPATVILSSLKLERGSCSYSSDVEVVSACFSKRAFQDLCLDYDLPVIPERSADEVTYPFFVKPIYGSSSLGAQIISTESEWDAYRSKWGSTKVIKQKYISGLEYTVDIYRSFGSEEKVFVSPRIRNKTLNGESVDSTISSSDNISAQARRLVFAFNLFGPLTAQFKIDQDTGEPMLMEVNPRFGGGVICSIEAGYDYPKFLLSEILGISLPDPANIKVRQLTMKRYFSEAFFENYN